MSERHPPGFTAQLAAFGRFGIRYRFALSPGVERELQRWRRRAQAIPDLEHRNHALTKLDDTAAHARLNASFATLAPGEHRDGAYAASVALQVMYDYLDGLTECSDSLELAVELYRLLGRPFQRDAASSAVEPDDGGYQRELAATCAAAFRSLPAHRTIAPWAAEVAARCADAQAYCHRASPEQFERWAREHALPRQLEWWEAAAGGSASVVTLHTLIALAADDGATSAAAGQLVEAYNRICPLPTLLDSLVDQAADEATGSHCYVGYYVSPAVAGVRIAAVARGAMEAAASLPHAAHHMVTVVGVAAYYLTAPQVASARIPVEPTIRELRPLVSVLFPSFRLMRRLHPSLFPPTAPAAPRQPA